MRTPESMLAVEAPGGGARWTKVGVALSSLLVATAVIATLLSFEAAPVDSDAAHAWAGLMPIAFIGIVGLRRTHLLLAIAVLLVAAIAALCGVVLLQMNHVSAGILIVFGVIGAVEAVVLLALQLRRASAT